MIHHSVKLMTKIFAGTIGSWLGTSFLRLPKLTVFTPLSTFNHTYDIVGQLVNS